MGTELGTWRSCLDRSRRRFGGCRRFGGGLDGERRRHGHRRRGPRHSLVRARTRFGGRCFRHGLGDDLVHHGFGFGLGLRLGLGDDLVHHGLGFRHGLGGDLVHHGFGFGFGLGLRLGLRLGLGDDLVHHGLG
ncbi:MAG: hypothetical protein M0007_00130, partial [Actinomycetota bacterium]|nr:hypothetical protein [Actinomycetota bacterium]